MDRQQVQDAIADITAEKDPTLKSLKLASLCSGVFRARGIEVVVVGGSAIEFYTEGAYASGDLDLCLLSPPTIPLRLRQELMGELYAQGGPRSWQVAGMFVDLLGQVESDARTPFRKLEAPYGMVNLMKVEDLLVERILVAVYPGPNDEALACARVLLAVILRGLVQVDWLEVRRLASLPEYRIVSELKALIDDCCHELKVQNPIDSY